LRSEEFQEDAQTRHDPDGRHHGRPGPGLFHAVINEDEITTFEKEQG
jgi:hypothetical protein